MKISRVCLTLITFMLIVSCATTNVTTEPPKMSYEEARSVVLSMQRVPMEPPPRKMDDILSLLNKKQPAGQGHMSALLRQADRPIIDGKSQQEQVLFYKSRGYARYELNRFNDAGDDLHRAIDLGKRTGLKDSSLYRRLAELEMRAGRYDEAIDFSKTAMRMVMRSQGGSSWLKGPYLGFQSRVQHRMGNFWRAGQSIKRAYGYYKTIPDWARYSLATYKGELRDQGTGSEILTAEAELLEAQGLYSQAYSLRAQVLNHNYSHRKLMPLGAVYARLALADNLMCQGRLVEAEREARIAVSEAMGIYGKYAAITATALQILGEVMLAKGDLTSADTLSNAQIEILEHLRLSTNEERMIRARLFRAEVLSAAYDFSVAVKAYDRALAGMQANSYLYRRYTGRNSDMILCLIKNRRIPEAEKLIAEAKGFNQRFHLKYLYGETEILALEAMVYHAKRNFRMAYEQFSKAIPDLLDIIKASDSNFQKRRRANALLQFYIEMLLEIYTQQREQAYGIDIVNEIFKLADARYSRVGSALSESSARAASLVNPELADLVRQEQDAGKKLKSLEATFHNAVAASGGAQSMALENLKRDIRSLAEARAAIIVHIENHYPKYTHYIRPSPPGIEQIQEKLTPDEAFVTIWTLEKKTCVWAICRDRDPAFAVVDLGEEAIRKKVAQLRRALQPNVRMLGNIPRFDLETAYDIYHHLLQPVESGWEGARSLLVVINGPLGQVPLSVLPVKKVKNGSDRAMLFDEYRSVPWLIRKVSLTRLPSAASLTTLRTLPAPNPTRESFAGFGDPIFNPAQIHETRNRSLLSQGSVAAGGIAIRGVREIETGQEMSQVDLPSVRIEQLCRLPDTADEIRQIAKSLKAKPARDVFLGEAATETNVKSQDLSRKKILAFATHALLPGDLDGLTQPALAFSSPEVTGLDEDGLLTLGEVLSLNLDADLVVLSACNTGAGDGRGNEAISGLGRAFFYSGARALLVTMWPVETSSANKLTTELFRYQQGNETLSRARAHQKSIIKLIEDPGMKDQATGKIAASYAHPFFWAPFVIVGEGGRPTYFGNVIQTKEGVK
jgi:CHAT domain-containing protein